MCRPSYLRASRRNVNLPFRLAVTSNAEESTSKPSLETTSVDAVSEKPVRPAEPIAPKDEYRVPGKIQLTADELAEQKAALDKYTLELRKRQIEIERESSRLFGWVPFAETLNGRFAMFFLAVGVLTEYWTGYTMPQQVELMLRTLGFF